MKYIVVTHGFPYTADSMPPCLTHLRKQDIVNESWLSDHVFDSESHFKYTPMELPSIGSFAKLLSRTIFNPIVPVNIAWKRVGSYSQSELIDAVKKGLEFDDDIIQQWFDGDQVIRMLEFASSWDETVLAVATISGAHEVDRSSLEFANRALGSNWNTEMKNAE